jgi:cystathionine beta-lyase family protein involved in aluminum resistance
MHKFWNCLKNQGICDRLITVAEKAETDAQGEFQQVSEITRLNHLKVLNAFRQAGISELHLKDGTGYGYGDLGREGLEEVFARAFGAEAALARAQIISGTHAIAIALTAFLDRGDLLLSVTGRPYDTLARIIGLEENSRRSLRGRGVKNRGGGRRRQDGSDPAFPGI